MAYKCISFGPLMLFALDILLIIITTGPCHALKPDPELSFLVSSEGSDQGLMRYPRSFVPCTKPNLPNGRVKLRQSGRLVYFKCKRRFLLVGSKISSCRNGIWSNLKPVCVRNGCDKPVTTDKILNTTSYFDDAVLKFSCPFGYKLTPGRIAIFCNGKQWSFPPPICTEVPTTAVTSSTFMTTEQMKTSSFPETSSSDEESSTEQITSTDAWSTKEVPTTAVTSSTFMTTEQTEETSSFPETSSTIDEESSTDQITSTDAWSTKEVSTTKQTEETSSFPETSSSTDEETSTEQITSTDAWSTKGATTPLHKMNTDPVTNLPNMSEPMRLSTKRTSSNDQPNQDEIKSSSTITWSAPAALTSTGKSITNDLITVQSVHGHSKIVSRNDAGYVALVSAIVVVVSVIIVVAIALARWLYVQRFLRYPQSVSKESLAVPYEENTHC